MTMKKQQRYTPEFRAEAVKLVTEQGQSQQAAADRLSIPKGTLANWIAAAKASSRPSAPGARTAAELENENARLRRELGLRCRQKRKFKATTNSKHNLPVAENLLNQTFMPSAPNKVWVADIT